VAEDQVRSRRGLNDHAPDGPAEGGGRSIGDNPPVRVSAKADYAVRAAIELAASSSSDSPVKGTVVSKAQKIPLRFLENILNELRHAGIVQRAPGGSRVPG
jgi:hypothetical protein